MWLINPFNGGNLDEHTLIWLKAMCVRSPSCLMKILDEADNAEVIRKLLDTLKSSF